MAPPLLPVHFQKQEKPTKPKPGGPRGRRSMLLVDPVRPFAALGFEGLDLVPGLLHRAGHEAADGVFLPAHRFHNLGQSGAVLPLEHGDHLGRLAALAGTISLRLRGFLGRLGGLLGRGRLLGRLGLGGRNTARLFRTLGLRGGFTRQASMLAPRMCRTSLQWPTDVSMITTVSLNNGSALINAASVAPSISDIW